MPRFLNTHLPGAKKIWVALAQVYGIGRARARALCFAIGATPSTDAAALRPHHLSQLYALVERRYVVGTDLRAATRASVQRLVRIRCFRGARHLQRLPVRGQRTHSNARTQKRRAPPHAAPAADG